VQILVMTDLMLQQSRAGGGLGGESSSRKGGGGWWGGGRVGKRGVGGGGGGGGNWVVLKSGFFVDRHQLASVVWSWSFVLELSILAPFRFCVSFCKPAYFGWVAV